MTKQISMTMLSCAVCLALGAQAQEVIVSTENTTTTDDCALMVRSGSPIEFTAGGVKIEVGDDPSSCLDDKSGSGGGSVTLDAQPTTVTSGDDVTVSWTVPDSPFICGLTKSGVALLSDSQIRNNTANQLVDQNVTASATYQMACSHTTTTGTESASATAKITVEGGDDGGGDGGTTEECPEQLSGFTRQIAVEIPNLSKTATTYEEMFTPWGSASNTAHVKMGFDRYFSLPFTIGDDRGGDSAFITWDQIHSNPESMRISVSQCIGPPMPGSAVPQSGDDSCYLQSNGSIGGFGMVVAGAGSASIECVLQPNTPYFLNVGWIDANGERGCDSLNCTWNTQEN